MARHRNFRNVGFRLLRYAYVKAVKYVRSSYSAVAIAQRVECGRESVGYRHNEINTYEN